ncbi:phosphotransferase [Falsarthrobacter nasiphocae]|uniref:Aminoglycoside phosphotransferase domain-containing protein n=1 Tax=Falsarthrobacter nasiphocae TaxID=189863 RepID=A0AAE3YDM5_9MICC|nr:phosphotransferase [Falsarthrobacter nasiphocae]MDR6891449.1 hypothetical protein [Falsarthrobacter nasiphocae]
MTSDENLDALRLAALASAALEGVSIVSVAGLARSEDTVSTQVRAADGERFGVISAETPEASTSLLVESDLLQLVAHHVGDDLVVATPAGRYSRGTLSTVVFKDIASEPLEGSGWERDPECLERVGRALAAIHLMPAHALEDAGLPFYEASEVRSRMLNLLDAAAQTGRVPSALLSRWEGVLDEAGLWRFTPTPVHGDLHEGQFRATADSIHVTGWSELCVADPAQDFAWVMGLDPAHRMAVLDAYSDALARRDHPRDTSLVRRSMFHAEFAVAEYLLTALRSRDDSRVSTASRLLLELARRLDPAATLPAPAEDGADDDAHSPEDGETPPEASAPEPSKPEASVPEASVPGVPEASVPGVPEASAPGASVPEEAANRQDAEPPLEPVGRTLADRVSEKRETHGSHVAEPETTLHRAITPVDVLGTDR